MVLSNNQAMCFLTIEDLFGTVEVIVFPRDFEKYGSLMEADSKIFISGRVSTEENKNGKLICEQAASFDDGKKEVWIQFADMADYESHREELMDLLRLSDGKDEVVLYLKAEKAVKRLGRSMGVLASPVLIGELAAQFGEDCVRIVEKAVTF